MVRQALNVFATVALDWLSGWAPAEGEDRYSRRFEEYRLPANRQDCYTDLRGRLDEEVRFPGNYAVEVAVFLAPISIAR